MNDEIDIVLSSVTHREDQDVEDEINELNKKLQCKQESMQRERYAVYR